MCVIIVKKPGIMIPYQKLDSACHVNNDGWGLSVLQERGTLLNYKKFDPKGNDPDEIYDLMERHKDHYQYLHLRFVTRGEKNLENTHPFPLIEEEDYQLYLMHNGTLSFSKFNIPDGQSDTRAFCEQYAAPTAKAFYTISGPDLLNNENFIRMMDHFITSSWYFTLYDNLGNIKTLGGNGHWHDNESWWSSNDYSFNYNHRGTYSSSYGSWWDKDDTWRGHRANQSSTTYYPRNRMVDGTPFTNKHGEKVYFNAKEGKYLPVEEKKDTTSVPSVTPANDKEPGTSVVPFCAEQSIKQQGVTLGHALAEAKRKGLDWAVHTPPKERPTFLGLTDLDSLEQVCLLNEEDLEELIGNYPEATLILIMDLLYELYTSKRNKKDMAA